MKKFKVIAVVQARMSSSRLPGKVMMKLSGRPIIWHIVNRIGECKNVDKTIVATSKLSSDDILADFCVNSGIEIFRGSLENVLSRYTDLIDIYCSEYVVRITGDCPLISPGFIDFQIEKLKYYDADLVWMRNKVNILEGQAVYSSRLLEKVKKNVSYKEDLEHVGSLFISKNPNLFKIIGIETSKDISKLNYRFSVDELKDYKFMKQIYSNLWKNNPISFKDALNYLENNIEINFINRDVNDSVINKNVKDNFKNWEDFIFKKIKLNISQL